MKKRLDVLLVERGLAASREKAKAMGHKVLEIDAVDGKLTVPHRGKKRKP